MLAGRTRQNKLVHFAPPHPLRARRRTPTVEITGAAPHHLARRRCVERHGRAPPPHPHPGRRRRDRWPAARRSPWSARPPRASRRWRWPPPGAVAGHRARLRRLHAGVPGHGHRHGQADAPPSRPRCPTTCSTWSTRRGLHRRRLPRRRTTRRSPASSAAATGPCSSAGTGLYLPAVRRPPRAARPVPRRRGPSSRPSPTPPALHRRLAELDPVGGRHASSPPTAAGSCGPSRSRSAAAARSPRSARASRPIPPTAVRAARRAVAPRRARRRASRRASPRCSPPASSTRSAALAPPAGCRATARQALGYRELLGHLDGAVAARRGRGRDRAAHPAVRPPPGAVVPPRPPHTLVRRRPTTRSPHCPRAVIAALREARHR